MTISIDYKGIFILKISKEIDEENILLDSLIKVLNKKDFKISKPTLIKYMDIFSALRFFTKIKSIVIIYEKNMGYERWKEI